MFILIRLLCFVGILSASIGAQAHGEKGSAGAGAGASYGVFGASMDIKIVGNLYGSVGLGAAGEDAGYNIGARYYLLDANRLWRPRLVVNYGTNGIIFIEDCPGFDDDCEEWDSEKFDGSTIGFGQSLAFGSSRRHGMDIDILYVVDDGGLKDRRDELERQGYEVHDGVDDLIFSIGYRYNF